MLALLGGALGLAIASGGLALFRAVAPATIPRLAEVAVDGRIAMVAMALSVGCAMLFGLLPARAAARSGVQSGARVTGSRTDFRRALVIVELALAFVLVTATGLMTRAFTQLLEWDPGFDPEGVTVVWSIANVFVVAGRSLPRGRVATTRAVASGGASNVTTCVAAVWTTVVLGGGVAVNRREREHHGGRGADDPIQHRFHVPFHRSAPYRRRARGLIRRAGRPACFGALDLPRYDAA